MCIHSTYRALCTPIMYLAVVVVSSTGENGSSGFHCEVVEECGKFSLGDLGDVGHIEAGVSRLPCPPT